QHQLALVAGRNAVHHVRQQGSCGTAKAVVSAFVQVHVGHTVLGGHGHSRQMVHRERALGALHRDAVGIDAEGDTLGQKNGLFCDTRHRRLLYATWPMTSPPRPRALACASVSNPAEVEMMEIPSPPSTLGNSSLPRYTRSPERLTRVIFSIAGCPSKYLSLISSTGLPSTAAAWASRM